jgi:formate-dependent nitrite reductase membrane component NrfD
MNLFVANPDWGWWIIGYFFLGGIAAACYFIAAFIELFGLPEDQPLARLGYRIAFPLVVVCGALLTVDLNRPERFWHMLFQSEVVHEALDGGWPWSAAGWSTMAYAPMLKYWSPMSIGAWALFLFGGFSFVSCWAAMWPAGRVARLLGWRWLSWPWHLAGSAFGFFVAAYTGVLLEATNQPLWSQTDWLGPLFLSSAASTGLATLILLGHRRVFGATTAERIGHAETWALGLELLMLAIFLISLRSWLPALARLPMGWVLLLGPLVIGILLPLVMRISWFATARAFASLSAPFVLVGGLVLRYSVIMVSPALLDHAAVTEQPLGTPTTWSAISPEDNRERGGGPGASILNRPDPIHPRSKVITEE